ATSPASTSSSSPCLPPKAHARRAGRDAEHLVDLRVIMRERIDAIMPQAVAPIVLAEGLLDRAREIARLDRATIDQEWQAIVRNRAVVFEDETRGFDLGARAHVSFAAGTQRRT